MSLILTIISFMVQLIVKILYIAAKAAVATAKVAVKTGKVIHKVEKSTRGARKAVRRGTTKAVKTTVKGAKKAVNTAGNVAKTAARGAKNVSNTAKTSLDLLSEDEGKRDTALSTIKNKAGNTLNKAGRAAGKLVIKSPKIMLKASIKTLKFLLLVFRLLTSCLAMLTSVFSFMLLGIAIAIIGSVSYMMVFSTSVAADGDLASSSTVITDTTVNGGVAGSAFNEAKDWKEVSQFGSSYKTHRYSTNKNGTDGTIGSCGCGLCSIVVVSEHYTGNQGKYKPTEAADELNKKFNYLCTNRSTKCITDWFNTMHPEIGLSCTDSISGDINLDNLDKTLASGGCAIVDYGPDVKYNGVSVWTSGGHYVTIIAGNQKDGYMVRDSNSGHWSGGSSGVAAWRPYHEHVFEKEYIQNCKYYYLITKK